MTKTNNLQELENDVQTDDEVNRDQLEARLRPSIHLTREQREGMSKEMLQQAEAAVVQAWMNYVRAKAALTALEAECQKL
jgi:hypothetical protein